MRLVTENVQENDNINIIFILLMVINGVSSLKTKNILHNPVILLELSIGDLDTKQNRDHHKIGNLVPTDRVLVYRRT